MPEERRFWVRSNNNRLQSKGFIFCDACLETPLTLILPNALVLYNRTFAILTAASPALFFTCVMSSLQNMSISTNSSIDHCRTPSQATYDILSWLMIIQFMLGLPLNLSVLYIFIFRYEETQALYRCLFPYLLK